MAEKQIIFDAGPIISLTINNMLWILKHLKQRFGGDFCISSTVKEELVDKPLKTKRFKFEALQVMRSIKKGVLEVRESKKADELTEKLYNLANNCVYAFNNPMKLVHHGEMSSLALALTSGSDIFVVDERTTRTLIEDPDYLFEVLKKKLKAKITIDRNCLDEFRSLTKNIRMIRSVEIVIVAYDMGLLKDYVIKGIEQPKKQLLEALLWGLKLNGCTISDMEINKIIKLETKKH